jgi:aryl-alcohol dehydrogenase-like predicted oxidoreductase
MKTKRIGSLEMSEIGLGTNSLGTGFFGTSTDRAGAARVVYAALDAGITFFDTAEEYSARSHWGSDGHSETFLGAALGARRNNVVIATKFMVPHQIPEATDKGYKRIMSAVEGSLRRLRTDRIDIYQQHFPDPDTPIDEHLEALDRLVKEDKVRGVRAQPWPQPARTRAVVARVSGHRRPGDGRRDLGRAGQGQRRRRELATDRAGFPRCRRERDGPGCRLERFLGRWNHPQAPPPGCSNPSGLPTSP